MGPNPSKVKADAEAEAKLAKLTPQERKKLKNKLKRKKQAVKRKATTLKPPGDDLSDIEEGEDKAKKQKKFYDPENEHNKKSSKQIERFKKKHNNPGKKLSKATPEQIVKYKKEYKTKMAAKAKANAS